jgi:hypothetical protein
LRVIFPSALPTLSFAPTNVGSRAFSYEADGNQTGFVDLTGTNRNILWNEENRIEAIRAAI